MAIPNETGSEATTVGVASGQLYPIYRARKHFSIQNNGTDDIFIHFGPGPATLLNGYKLTPGNLYEPYTPLTGEIHAITSGAGGQACVKSQG